METVNAMINSGGHIIVAHGRVGYSIPATWPIRLPLSVCRATFDVRNQAMAKLNQLEHDEPAETMNQLQVLKERSEPAGSCIEKLAEESYSKKKIQVISTADESVSSRKDINEEKRERGSDVVLRFSRWIIVDDVISDVIQSQDSAEAIYSRSAIEEECGWVKRVVVAQKRKINRRQQQREEQKKMKQSTIILERSLFVSTAESVLAN
ncbi:cytospin-A-like [Dorcoceras hygrometricum]|uniref:Cytospin-A-like n=1 Tax=Dorcoceras hygrometricum TaxID=472368 RepID=A0A2Z7CR89_9LAMI|nr:cytospin-A-like [Dorcoceras hygrometricum]